MSTTLKICLLSTVLLFCFGCSNNHTDYYAQWEAAREQGNDILERQCLLHVMASGNMPEAHYRYGELCRKNDDELGVAAWHFRKFAELLPDSAEAKEALKQAETCEKRQMQRWLQKRTNNQYASLEEMTERLRLIEEHCQTLKKRWDQLEYENQQLQKTNQQLQAELTQERKNHGKR